MCIISKRQEKEETNQFDGNKKGEILQQQHEDSRERNKRFLLPHTVKRKEKERERKKRVSGVVCVRERVCVCWTGSFLSGI